MVDDEDEVKIGATDADDDEDDEVVTHPPLELARADEVPDDPEED